MRDLYVFLEGRKKTRYGQVSEKEKASRTHDRKPLHSPGPGSWERETCH